MSIHNDQKKSILNKLFKNGTKMSPHANAISNNYTTVNSSFNEQLMNQTNFGFNPARQTIVSTPNNNAASHHQQREIMAIEPVSRERRELNTQKRNRTQTIQIESPVGNQGMNMHQRGGSLNIQELYQHYHSKPKASGVPSHRVNNHQAQAAQQLQNNMIQAQFNQVDGAYPQNQQQLFLPGTMKMQVVARKTPVTQHQ